MPPVRHRLPFRLPLWLLPALLAGISPPPVTAAEPSPADPRGQIGRIQLARPGPWGTVEYTRIIIEPPDEFMHPDYRWRDHSVWKFPGYTRAGLDAFWAEAGLDPGQVAALRAPGVVTVTPAGLTVKPGADLVRSLSPASRGHIYNTLAALPDNPMFQMPFRFRDDLVDEWLDEPGLPAAVTSEVRRLLYHRGNSVLFADPDLVLPLLPTAEERVRLIKTLSRKSTLFARLRITPGTDVDALVDYWGRGPRRKDVRPLLRSLTRHRDGIALDISHLLPRFARGLLYTYPPNAEPPDTSLDCHWTSMNFFRDEPDPRFADLAFVVETIKRDYAPLPAAAPRLFGDLILLAHPDGGIFHSCVHVFDDIVFTKNGYSPQMPWTLSTMRDMLAAYPLDPGTQVRVYRRKE